MINLFWPKIHKTEWLKELKVILLAYGWSLEEIKESKRGAYNRKFDCKQSEKI